MNRPRHLSVANDVRSRIKSGSEDRLWTYSDFPDHPRMAVAASLSRLKREGVIRRVRRGIYYRSRTTVVGVSRPDPEMLVDKVLVMRGLRPVASGVGQYNRMGLTTQASSTITRAVGRRLGRTIVSGVPTRFTERPLDRQVGIYPDERTALDALRDLTRVPDASPQDVLKRLKTLIRSNSLSFERLARYAIAEPPRVRALLGAIGEDIREDSDNKVPVPKRCLNALRATLNPLTSYRLSDAGGVLTHAKGWHIKEMA